MPRFGLSPRAAIHSVAVALALGGGPAIEGGDDPVAVRPYAGYLPGAAPDGVLAILVRDGPSGRPIAGARVRRLFEDPPDGETVRAPAVGEWRTDEHGIVNVVLSGASDERYASSWAIDAPWHWPTEVHGEALEHAVELGPGVDLHGVIVDAFGRPTAGIEVAWGRGGAAEPLRLVRTDAKGRFVLPSISTDGFWYWGGPGVRTEFGAPDTLVPTTEPPPVLRGGLAIPLRGRIVGADLPSRRSLAVRGRSSRWSPRGAVAPDGSFVLEALGPGDPVDLLGADEARGEREGFESGEYRPGGPVRIDLVPTRDPRPRIETTVRVAFPKGVDASKVEEWVFVIADALDDGRRTTLDVEGEMEEKLLLAPGAYDLSADSGSGIGPWFAPPRRIEVAPGAPPIVLPLTARPRLAVTGLKPSGEDAPLATLVVPLAETSFYAGDRLPWVPADCPAVVWVEGVERPFPVGSAHDGVREVTVDPRPTATIRVRGVTRPRLVRFAGRGVQVVAREDGGFDLPWHGPPGEFGLEFHHGAERDEIAVAKVKVPPGPGAVVDLHADDLRQVPQGAMTIDRPPGLADGECSVVAWPRGRETPLVEIEARTFSGPWVGEGTWVRVTSDAFHAFHARLEGPGPWLLGPGTATLVVRVPRGAARLEDCRALLDGSFIEAYAYDGDLGPDFAHPVPRDSLLTAHGLFPGDHVLIVGAPRRRSMEARVRLREGETREVVVALPPK